MFIQDHLDVFRASNPLPPLMLINGEGRPPQPWFKAVDPSLSILDHGKLPPKQVNRKSLLAMQSNPLTSIEAFCVCVFAWGGMRVSNGKHLFGKSMHPWLNVANQLRNGTLNRKDGYEAFINLRKYKSLSGLGPAYFTKLLYFLPPPKNNGYIMDQWLGLSINLLTGSEIVRLNESITFDWKPGTVIPNFTSMVCDHNTADGFEKFCQAIEDLSKLMGPPWTPELVELALISEGGPENKRRPWRKHVVEQRRKRLLAELQYSPGKAGTGSVG
jgi:hypothetical protein